MRGCHFALTATLLAATFAPTRATWPSALNVPLLDYQRYGSSAWQSSHDAASTKYEEGWPRAAWRRSRTRSGAASHTTCYLILPHVPCCRVHRCGHQHSSTTTTTTTITTTTITTITTTTIHPPTYPKHHSHNSDHPSPPTSVSVAAIAATESAQATLVGLYYAD